MRASLAVALALSCPLAACGDDGDGAPDAAPGIDAASAPDAATDVNVFLDFSARVNGAPFACGQSYPGVGATGATYVGTDFRFYVHDVRLIGPRGDVPVALEVGPYQAASGTALLDFENGEGPCQMGTSYSHTQLFGWAPPGTTGITGVRFKLGVPFAENHLDATTAAAPLNVPAMYWAWSSGYKFLKADGTVNGAGFNLHLGSTACPATGQSPPTGPCTNPNVVEVTLDDFDYQTEVIVADVGALLVDEDVSVNTAETAPGCMSFPGDPECDTVLPKLGLPYGDVAAGDQAFFTAAARP
jgi:uncharacterized repeat protein (TIGR04052 family)